METEAAGSWPGLSLLGRLHASYTGAGWPQGRQIADVVAENFRRESSGEHCGRDIVLCALTPGVMWHHHCPHSPLSFKEQVE